MNIAQLSRFGTVKETKSKHYIEVLDGSLKKALIMKRKVHLEDSSKKYCENMRVFSPEDTKKRHMGKIKCICSYKSDEELANILSMYFS
jgi:aminoglycoside N3'-acetyltransferase